MAYFVKYEDSFRFKHYQIDPYGILSEKDDITSMPTLPTIPGRLGGKKDSWAEDPAWEWKSVVTKLPPLFGLDFPSCTYKKERIRVKREKKTIILLQDEFAGCTNPDYTINFTYLNKSVQENRFEIFRGKGIVFLPDEIALYTNDPIYVTAFGLVYNITNIIHRYRKSLYIQPLLQFAGKDITHWFNDNHEILTHIDPSTLETIPFFYLRPFVPFGLCAKSSELPWWKDCRNVVGFVTRKSRKVIVYNTLIEQSFPVECCEEDTIYDVVDRYNKYSGIQERHYVVRYNGRTLKMDRTLEENGIPDYEEFLEKFRANVDIFVPQLFLYFLEHMFQQP